MSHSSSDSYNQYQISEEKPDHHFRTEIPNIIFELDFSPAAFCVYAHLKRIAGDDGACFKSIKNLAKDCRMSENLLRTCLDELSETSILIGDDPLPGQKERFRNEIKLIKIKQRKKEDKSCDTNLITITPIWRLNGDVMRSKFKKISGGSNSEGGVVQNLKGGGSNFEPKEEPIKKNPKEQQQQEEVVVVDSNDKSKHQCAEFAEKMRVYLKEFSETRHKKWRLTWNELYYHCLGYGWKYVMEQLNYMIKIQQQSEADELVNGLARKTKPIDKPGSYLSLAIKANYAKNLGEKSNL